MSRSIKKGPFVASSLVKKIDALNAANENKIVKTWSRASTILPSFVGHTIAVHEGSSTGLMRRKYNGSSGNL